MALFVRPVMQDLAERLHLAGGGNRIEEASADELASIPHTALRQKPVRIGGDLRLLDEHAADPGMPLERGGQQGTGASAYIHDRAHAGPVVRARDLLVFVAAQSGEGPVEHISFWLGCRRVQSQKDSPKT